MEKLRAELIPKVVERLKALADETRLRLLLRLREGEANVTDLSRELGVAQASISKHLSTMRQVGLVQLRREGVQSIYSVRDESVFDMCEIVCEGVVRHMQEEHAALAPDVARSGRGQAASPRRRGGRREG
jgi:ArsR family transcriptional regulator